MLVGSSSTGKSAFARKHFLSTEVVSSDQCRALVSGDENDQTVTKEAFDLVHAIIDKRLKRRRLTVVDATNVQPASRRKLIALARAHQVDCVAIVLDLPEDVVLQRHAARADRKFPIDVIARQRRELAGSLHELQQEGVRVVHILRQTQDVDGATVIRVPAATSARSVSVPPSASPE